MPRSIPLVSLVALSLLIGPALADGPPPPDAMPLSQILQTLEQQGDLAYFKEIDWDDDGYWEIDYVTTDGSEREITVDPVTGQPRS
jgi:hypothetical protein